MKILVIGTGYVGLVVGAGLAETGNDVVCADIDSIKIANLRNNIIPIYEPGLEELVRRNQDQGRLRFTDDVPAAARDTDVVFIAVGTPPGEDGSADLRHVLAATETVGANLTREAIIVTKSTVPVGTARKVAEVLARCAKVPVHVSSNPEFLKEGAAVDDFLRPDRVVIGVDSEFARGVLSELYSPFVRTGKPILFMDVASAELTKYAANAMLATRISFMNEMAILCEKVGANIDDIRRGMGSDPRIGSAFLFPGPGYGGSCFPKDVKALMRTGAEHDVPMRVVNAVEAANESQKHVLFHRVREALGGDVRMKRIAIWGLSFKPQTDDLRESPALALIDQLLAAGASVVAHDPVAMRHARNIYGERITFAESNYDALTGSAALVVVTDWNEYRHPNFDRMLAELSNPIVVDGRNLYRPEKMAALGFTYVSIGRPHA